jgi:hypothetical protein
MYLGLLAILSIPTILNVLVHTNQSSSDYTAYKRYMQTIYHTLLWFRNDLKPGTKAWKSLEGVRKHHFHANKSAKSSKVGMISQKDMAVTQYGFMGFTIASQKYVGFQGSQQAIEDYCHFFRVLGSVIGIKDEYNICCETYEETMERLEVIKTEFLRPNLETPPEEFEAMTRYIANGLWCFNPADSYENIMFVIKRMIGVPDYYYDESEIPAGYDKSKLKYRDFSLYEKFDLWTSVFVHEYLLQFKFIRVLLNFQTLVHEYLIRYFPFLAFYKFGFKKSFITIPADKDKVE